MCDPTVLAVAGTVAGVAGQAANYFGQQSAAEKQKQAYDEWAANQKKIRAEQEALQEEQRQKADAARQQGLQDVSAESQKSVQAQEQDRLTKYLQGQTQQPTAQPDAAIAVSDKAMLSGQQGGDSNFQTDLAKKLNDTAAETKQRIAALAAVQSYGGSSGGLDLSNKLAFQKAGMGIDEANDFRRGDLAMYGVQRAVDPLQYSYTPSPLSGLSDTAFKLGTQGLGNMMAKAFTA